MRATKAYTKEFEIDNFGLMDFDTEHPSVPTQWWTYFTVFT